jgi:LmbE family N-acetylglucosaminyl deacetylase
VLEKKERSRRDPMNSVPERALVICAHPDDLDFGCCGTVALWRRAGAQVAYVICTNGDKGSDDLRIAPQELARMRKEEQRKAALTVGVEEVLFLEFPDGELENSLDLRRQLVGAIRRVRPQVVLCQDPANRTFENVYVAHRDHRVAGEAAFDALYPAAGNARFFPDLLDRGLAPHKVQEVYFFGSHAPNHWVDITSVMDLKLQALNCHTSQVAHRESFEAFIRDRFREAGRTAGYAYAEPFRRLPLPP